MRDAIGDSANLDDDDFAVKVDPDGCDVDRPLVVLDEKLGLLECVGACDDDVEVFRALLADEEGIGVSTVPFEGGGRGIEPLEDGSENCDEPGAEVDMAPS